MSERKKLLGSGLVSILVALCVMSAMGQTTASTGQSEAGAASPGRSWTLPDIVQAPEISDLSISEDGKSVMYIVRRGDLATNAKRSWLHLVDLATGVDRELGSSPWFSRLQAVPGSNDWSLLADLGEGVQLYRVDHVGRFTALLVNHDTDQAGGGAEGLRAFGVWNYGWAPDGSRYWYEKRTAGSPGSRVVNPPFFPMSAPFGIGPIELRIKHISGEDVPVDSTYANSGGFYKVDWNRQSSALSYWTRLRDESLEKREWTYLDKTPRKKASAGPSAVATRDGNGFKGGQFGTTGFGATRKLVESLNDGSVVDYGHVQFKLDPRGSETWLSPDGNMGLLGVRYVDVPKYGLVRVTPSGEMEELAGSGSLTDCTVNVAFTAGACVRQSMVSPPELVSLDPRGGGIRSVIKLAPEYAAIAPLKVVPKAWTNRHGFKANGFIVYPRNYEAGRKYPAILVNHGGDADEKFVNVGFQWDYPVQAWAERGYIVVAMNLPTVSESAELTAAYAQWEMPGPLPLERVQDLIWVNSALSFEDAIKELAAEGIVDASRVGIAGYSNGSQMVNVTMTQSRMFRAASSGDGGYLEPSAYFVAKSYLYIYGGSPYDAKAVPNYRRLSPTFRAEQAAGPILQQVALGAASQLELHVALRQAGMPSELVYYPNESHLFHQPLNRLTAMQENIDWFDFWLLGKEDADPSKKDQYKRWTSMRDEQKRTN